MDSIKEWLNGSRNYHQGAALYDAYGDDVLLKQMFAQGESEYRKERLLKALRALLATAKQVAIPVAPPSAANNCASATGRKSGKQGTAGKRPLLRPMDNALPGDAAPARQADRRAK